MEIEQHMIPHIPYLIQDLWAMGCSLEQIVEAAGSLGLAPGKARVLDLGCGKGAVSVRLAATCGFHVLGIDAVAPFLEVARTRAEEYGVAHLCRFEEQDMMEYVSVEHDFDLVVFASLDGLLGSIEETVATLRSQVRSGGSIIIDDGYLKNPGRIDRRGYHHYRDHEGTVRELTAYHDRLVRELSTSEASRKINREYLEVITRRAEELVLQHPELKEDIDAYIRLQQEECDILDEHLEGALWVLEKKGDGEKNG